MIALIYSIFKFRRQISDPGHSTGKLSTRRLTTEPKDQYRIVHKGGDGLCVQNRVIYS